MQTVLAAVAHENRELRVTSVPCFSVTAQERTRTSTGFNSHQALNLARLPIPPLARTRPETSDSEKGSDVSAGRITRVTASSMIKDVRLASWTDYLLSGVC